jgi:hypothetical protein
VMSVVYEGVPRFAGFGICDVMWSVTACVT